MVGENLRITWTLFYQLTEQSITKSFSSNVIGQISVLLGVKIYFKRNVISVTHVQLLLLRYSVTYIQTHHVHERL